MLKFCVETYNNALMWYRDVYLYFPKNSLAKSVDYAWNA